MYLVFVKLRVKIFLLNPPIIYRVLEILCFTSCVVLPSTIIAVSSENNDTVLLSIVCPVDHLCAVYKNKIGPSTLHCAWYSILCNFAIGNFCISFWKKLRQVFEIRSTQVYTVILLVSKTFLKSKKTAEIGIHYNYIHQFCVTFTVTLYPKWFLLMMLCVFKNCELHSFRIILYCRGDIEVYLSVIP